MPDPRRSSTAPRTSSGRPGSRSLPYLLVIVVVFVAGMAVRFVRLDADPVPWFTEEIGYHIDEGYKTLSPRNLAVFGTTHWHPEDQYRGWMRDSALTQWPYYWSFRAFGTDLSRARGVSVVYFGLFLAATAVFLWKRLSPAAATLGVVLLVFDAGLFFFSRSALFETALTLFTFLPLYVLAWPRGPGRPSSRALSAAGLFLFLLLPFFFLKMSVVLYLGPILGAFLFQALREREAFTSRLKLSVAVGMVAVGGLALLLAREPWILAEVNLAVLRTPQRLLFNPIHTLTPVALLFAYGVLVEMLLRRPSSILHDAYRLSLAALVVLAPIGLAFFSYPYPRYYLPIVPAALLLLVERFSLRGSAEPLPRPVWRSPSAGLAALVFACAVMTLLASSNYYILRRLPLPLGEEPGLSLTGLLWLYPLLLLVLGGAAALLVRRRPALLSLGRRPLLVLVSIHVAIGGAVAVAGLADPSYRSRTLADRLVATVGEDATVGGDWAPFLGASTELRVLYMRPGANGPEQVEALRPDYFVHSDTPYDRRSLGGMRALDGVLVGDPIPLGSYFGHPITLYPLGYSDGSSGSAAGQP